MNDFRLPFFDPDFCLKVARWASAVCFGWLLVELTLLAALTPDPNRCAGWTIHRHEPSEIHVGVLILMFTVLPAAWIFYVTLRWDHFAERMFKSILARPDLAMNHNQLFVIVSAGWVLFCAVPLGMMLSSCTNWIQQARELLPF